MNKRKTCAIIILEFIDNKLIENNGKWIRLKSKDVKNELNIKSNNWNKIWNNKIFLQQVKEKRIKQNLLRVGGKQGDRKINWIIKY